MSRAIMFQGAGSNVGKSLLVAGFLRAAQRRGLRVLPFKPQNMSNNAAVTPDGGEIGRAQALQAWACKAELCVDMNPILLKPETDVGAQVIVQGRRIATLKARDYFALKPKLIGSVLESFARLKARADLVVVEGAGGASEINLRHHDIANMGFAQASQTPVVLIGDIDRGGVIAQIVGAREVLAPQDCASICGFVINKFRGDPTLFDDGYRFIEQRTGWRGFGVLPFFEDAAKLPAEDALDLKHRKNLKNRVGEKKFHIAALQFSRIANFDDLDPLAQEPGVEFSMVGAGEVLPGDCDLVLLPGTKSTRGDLDFLRAQGWDIDLTAHLRRGGKILGLCGGYQMLGRAIHDPFGVEGAPGSTPGLGWLDVETTMAADKKVLAVRGVHCATDAAFEGYEIHIGRTHGSDCARPFAIVAGEPDGAICANGQAMGSYVHGAFANDGFRSAFLHWIGAPTSTWLYRAGIEKVLDGWADVIEQSLDVAALLEAAR